MGVGTLVVEQDYEYVQRTGRNQLGPDAPWYVDGRVYFPGTAEYAEREKLEHAPQASSYTDEEFRASVKRTLERTREFRESQEMERPLGVLEVPALSDEELEALKTAWKIGHKNSQPMILPHKGAEIVQRPRGLPISSSFAMIDPAEQERMNGWDEYHAQKAEQKRQKKREKQKKRIAERIKRKAERDKRYRDSRIVAVGGRTPPNVPPRPPARRTPPTSKKRPGPPLPPPGSPPNPS